MSKRSLYKPAPIPSSEITPEPIYRAYQSRRRFLKLSGALGVGAILAACAPGLARVAQTPPPDLKVTTKTDELGDPLNTYEEITNYNNYYEFTTDKEGVAGMSKDFKTSPWQVEVSGLVNKPKTFGLEDLIKLFQPEERIYRLRCVEAWSMVIPWNGFQLSKLLDAVEPTPQAKYVRFETIMDKEQMRGERSSLYPWPYQEGLTMAEAMHPLAILATGLYGKMLPPQNGAPVRLVVPWKYGFKSIKAIVKIELVDFEPNTMWSTIAPDEYGFYANVNPAVPHPRWSQATERRIGAAGGRRATLPFNGYADQVANLYKDLNLKEFY